MTFRTRTFLAVFLASSLALAVSTILVERWVRRDLYADVEHDLLNQARLAGALLSHRETLADPDGEADALGRLTAARVTFVAADGRVVGDSAVDASDLPGLENHAAREEIVEAGRSGEGSAVRRSRTTEVETMYAAVAVQDGPVAYARMALSLTSVADRLSALRRLAFVGLGAGLLATFLVTWLASALLNRRIRAVAETAQRYRSGDFSRPARDHGRDEIGIVANVLDDTARALGERLAETARGRAHMDAILTGMVEGIVLVNADGRLVLTNPAVRSMLRLPEPAEGRHYLEVVRQPDLAALFARALSGESPPPVEVQHEPDARRSFGARVVPLASERAGGAALVLHDITDLRRADQVRRDFVANVSHELGTPLTAIRGYLEALLDTPPPSPDESRRFLDVIARQAEKMERLVKDLLRLARLDAGRERLDRSPCDVGAIVASVDRDLSARLASRRQRIEAKVAGDAAELPGDGSKLADALRNLVENASNYGPEGSAIEIAARRNGASVEITVADRGPGIPEADLQRIFERFYRVDRSRTVDPGGTGLGLSIAKHLVELHGGRILSANRPGGGAIMTMVLPAG